MGIFMTEELSESEIAELEALQIEIMTPPETAEDEEGENNEETQAGDQEGAGNTVDEEGEEYEEIWKDFPIDPATGYAVDPNSGNYVDPVTGAVIGGSYDNGTSQNKEADTEEEKNTEEASETE